jgi:hypothetical protein
MLIVTEVLANKTKSLYVWPSVVRHLVLGTFAPLCVEVSI